MLTRLPGSRRGWSVCKRVSSHLRCVADLSCARSACARLFLDGARARGARKRITFWHVDPEPPQAMAYQETTGRDLIGPDRNHARRHQDAEDHPMPVVQRPSGRGSPLLYLHFLIITDS